MLYNNFNNNISDINKNTFEIQVSSFYSDPST